MRFVLCALLVSAAAAQSVPFKPTAPFGLPPLPVPEQAPLTEAAFRLGEKLFFDPILSLDRTVSCSTCHLQDHSFSHPAPRPPGIAGKRALRHAPALVNRVYGKSHQWDGGAATLEEFALLPIQDPNEMANSLEEVERRLTADPWYPQAFAAVHGQAPNSILLARSLATFVRGLTMGNSPVDHFDDGDRGALTIRELAGAWVFESRGKCWKCHVRPFFTDELFHNTGIGVVDGVPEEGRAAVTGQSGDRGRFKTPTLRGLAQSAPYMHDGSLQTLEEVVAFYREGGHGNPHLSPLLQDIRITDEDGRNLVAFLRALSREVEK